MQLLDATIVNVALPSIAVDLGAPVSTQLLMVSIYTLSFACALITAARLGDILGRRRVFLAALAAFVVASVLCGLATSGPALVVFRALQGLAAGSMSAQTFAIISALFPKRAHPRVFGIYGATIALATVSGPLAGGLLIEWNLFDLGWRMIFLINLPIGALALIFGAVFLVDARATRRPKLDPVGAVLSALGLVLLIYPLVEGRERGWPAPIVAMLVASIPVLALFVWYEHRLGRRGGDPVLRLGLFRDSSFSRGALLALLFFGTLTSLIFTISLTLQFGFGFSPLRAGITTLPWAIGTGIAAVLSSMVYRRIGNLVLPTGMLLFGGSLLLTAEILGREGTDPRWLVLAGPLLLGGAGLGLFVAPLQSAILASVRPANSGSVSGLLPTIQQVGSSLGLALIGIVFFQFVAGQADTAVNEQRPAFAARLESAGIPSSYVPQLETRFADCATAQLGSSSPMHVPDECADAGTGASAAPQAMVDSALAAAHDATRAAAGEAFLVAQQRVMWSIAGVSVVVAALSLTLPRRNRIVEPDALSSDDDASDEPDNEPEPVPGR
ncbi:MFS transporter [Rhodococcus rhodnii]|uniref:Multidrug ABC transporter n=2 Tax=Rhodococcus rhodnii TaxID=38312 RepID=R7WJG2_9NOCA|nr:MFS transporter [Rhodococcus rhodnii]EOM75405.1 multidrug ABC transporter [Rhodococcus rhodnii LMG 5362]